ncbi:MAG TPA: hypothetical protein VF219_05380 [Vicinamibacterales bacterium]
MPEQSSESNKKEPATAGSDTRLIPPRVRLPLIVTVAVIAVAGIAYYFYYGNQADYFTGRNLRLLSMLTAQIDGRMEMYSGFATKNSAIQGIKSVECKPSYSPPFTAGELRREILPSPKGWNVVLQTTGPCYVVPLASVLRPVFGRRTGVAFDVIVVARDDGLVLYGTRQPPSTSTLLRHEEEWIDEETEEPHIRGIEASGVRSAAAIASEAQADAAERESASTLVLTNLRALSRVTGWRGEPAPLKPQTLLDANGQTEVALNGKKYVLFSQPYIFARPAVTLDHKPRRWVVCGLVSVSRFRDDALAISTTVVLIAAAIAVLALCCWPFLRIALIDPRQALTITDVVLVVVCTVVGTAVITLGLLDGLAYAKMSKLVDEQLQEYGDKLDEDFGKDVGRAMDMLAAAERDTQAEAFPFEPKVPGFGKTLAVLQPNGNSGNPDPKIQQYPYIHSIQWVNDRGEQTARFDRISSPLQNVSDRQYFQLAMHDRTTSVNGKPYILQWVRSRSSGEVTADFAKKTTHNKSTFVVVVDTELIDISHPVPPPGVQMAIIDESGEVIYHSDVGRIGYENFLVEADRDRELRAAVLARRADFVKTTYWGEDQSMYVRPLTGSTWTLVTFRPKRLTRVLNVEAALLTLLLLLACAAPLLLLFILVLLIFPGYRAPRLWPHIARTRDYARLTVVLIALLLLFCVDIYVWAPWDSFWAILILPSLAFVGTYVLLHRTGAERRYRIAIGVWLALQAGFILHVFVAGVDPIHHIGNYPWALRSILLLAAIGVTFLPLDVPRLRVRGKHDAHEHGRHPASELLRRLGMQAGYSRLYRLCAALLLMVGVVMPVSGLFAISRRVESELLVKYAQLRAAADLKHRIDQVVTLNAFDMKPEPAMEDVLCKPLPFIFSSGWGLRPEVKPFPKCGHSQRPAKSPQNAEPIPPKVAEWLPVLYEDSLAIRPLFESQSSDCEKQSPDCLWRWQADGRNVDLASKVHFDVDVSNILWPDSKPNPPPQQGIVISSGLPPLYSDTHINLLAGLLIVVALFVVSWSAATFIAKRVFLIDISEPDWLGPFPLFPSLGDSIFLVRRDLPPSALTGNDASRLRFFDVSFKDLHEKERWDEVLQEIDRSTPGRNVRIHDFEYGIDDAQINEEKLSWLERLLALPDRTVVAVSSLTPAYMMVTAAPVDVDSAAYFARWRAVFDRFVCISAEELIRRREEWRKRRWLQTVSELAPLEPKNWQERETSSQTFLQQLAQEIKSETEDRRFAGRFDAVTDRDRLRDEIGERAETYYAGLWANCREDEKLLLDQIATNGLANARNRRELRRLMARGLVRRDPDLRLFSDTFRLYVLAAARRENIASRARARHGPSTWDALRVPFFVVIIAFVLLLFATQKDLLTTTTALATALGTGLPVLAKLVGVFTERRMDSPDRT